MILIDRLCCFVFQSFSSSRDVIFPLVLSLPLVEIDSVHGNSTASRYCVIETYPIKVVLLGRARRVAKISTLSSYDRALDSGPAGVCC